MAKTPEPGAAERAARLREQIDKLTKPKPAGAEADKPAKDEKEKEAPRDFIHRRMQELDKDDKK